MPHFQGSIASKLPHVGTTIFTVMSRLAAEHQAINLSQGFPDFGCDPLLPELVNKHMTEGKNQYAPMQGLPQLRETIAQKLFNDYGASYHPETEITITAGGTQAIYSAIAALVKQGDEVILFAPAYDCYEPAITMCGAQVKEIALRSPDFRIDWEVVRQTITPRTRMIILNTPHNPTGTVLRKEDMLELEKITHNTDILVLSDEVYEHIIFDGKEHQSVCRFPGLAERSIMVYSFGKMFHITGWKTGYAVGPANLMAEFRKAHQFIVFCVNTPVQYALNEYLSHPDHYHHLPKFYQQKRDYFLQGINESRFKPLACEGTYFQLLDYSNISQEKDTDMAIRLTKEFRLASIPVSVFYQQAPDQHLLRFCFAKKEETLDRAIEIINRI
jgi:methionine aminotransferase